MSDGTGNIIDIEPIKKKKKKETAHCGGKRAALRKRFPKLYTLRCWEMAETKIKAGIALEEVTRWIQDDMFEYMEVKKESLTRTLYRFKSALINLYPDEVVQSVPNEVEKQIENMKRGVNELDELEKLYLLQLKRIGMDVATETKINKLFKTTALEIRVAQDLLAKRMEIKMKMGIVPTVSELPQGTRQQTGSLPMTTDSLQIDDEQRLKLGVVAEKIMSAFTSASDREVREVINITKEADSP